MKSPVLLLLAALPLFAAEPKPVTLTFYVAGVECPSCAYSVNYAIEQLKHVSEVEAGQVIENYANVTFDPRQVSPQQIAHAVTEAVPLHGTPYEATLKLRIPDYAKAGHAKRVDALFASWKDRVEAVRIDAATGEFILHFKPLPAAAAATGPRGWTLAELEQGLKGLPYVLSSEGLEATGAQ